MHVCKRRNGRDTWCGIRKERIVKLKESERGEGKQRKGGKGRKIGSKWEKILILKRMSFV